MTPPRPVHIQPDWHALLAEEFASDYMQALSQFLRERREAGATLYPPAGDIFRAFWETPPQGARVVILGQDPYHGPRQAHGLCFSVLPGTPVPPSLGNIYRELQRDLGLPIPDHGCLLPWARQGVLLLNAVLTVERGRAGAHQGKGWERFTDAAIDRLMLGDEPRVFLLWGAQAKKKGQRIDRARHCVLTAPHPSPLSAHRGFLGCGHFSQANAWLESRGLAPIDWRLPPMAELGNIERGVA